MLGTIRLGPVRVLGVGCLVMVTLCHRVVRSSGLPPIPPAESPRAPPAPAVAVAASPRAPPMVSPIPVPHVSQAEGSTGGFGRGVGNPEEPAKYIMELPKLAQADLSVSAVTCGNWWAQIKQIFTGLSPSATEWFSSVERAATRHYNQWLVADPLGRLSLDPGGVATDFDSFKFQRVESRAVSLLLAAIPQGIKEDLITNRWLTSASILFRILCIYQPGGSTERAHLLSQLVSPDISRTHKEAIASLRKWTQNLQRAREVNASLPDPSLLIKGIDTATGALIAQNPMINFRISSFRHRIALDYLPTLEGIVQLVRLILAECESASLVIEGGPDKKARAAAAQAAQAAQAVQGSQTAGISAGSLGAEAKGQGTGAGQALAAMVKAPGADAHGGGPSKGKGKGGGQGGNDGPAPCHNFSNAVGCRYGDSCKFKHDRAKARKDRRCLACGQSGHYRPECAVVPAELRQGPSDSSAESASPKSPEPKKPAAKPKPKAGTQAKGISEDVQGSSGAQVGQGNGSGNSSVPGQQELLAEAQKLLKGISLKAVHVRDPLEAYGIDKAWLLSAVVNASSPTSASDVSYALVDSGATNGLREARAGEWENTQSIKVDLASGVAELHVNGQGTLLSPSDCQVIIPAGWLVELGYRISWKRKGCSIRHPDKGRLDVKVVKGCPLIPKEDGLRLLEDYEGLRSSERFLRKVEARGQDEGLTPGSARGWLRKVLRTRGDQGPSQHEQEVFLRGMFPELPERYVSQVSVPALDPDGFDYGPLPWNRRFRRSISRAKPGSVMVHMFAGTKCWKGIGNVVTVGKSCQSDPMSQPVFQQVLRWASSGVVGGLVGALPRHGLVAGSGSPRGRFGNERWGRSDLSGDEQGYTDLETVQWFRFFLVFAVAQAAREASLVDAEASAWEPDDAPPEGVKDPKELAVWALRQAAVKLKRANIERAKLRSTVFLAAEYPRDPAEGLGVGVTELGAYSSLLGLP